MAKLAVGTVVRKNYLPFARVLADSFRRYHPDIPFFVLVADEVDGYFEPATESFHMLHLDDLPIPDLRRFSFHYSRHQVVVAAKSYLLSYLLDHGFASAIFLDADILVLGHLDPLFAVVEKNAIVLTPHLLAPVAGEECAPRELNILVSGTYNAGFLGVSDTPSARSFLAWWQDRLYRHCSHAVTRGMHYDQRWLDLVPVFFGGAHILRDPSYNVAYWNLPERNIRVSADLALDNETCRFFHFSGFDPERPSVVTRYSPRLTVENVGPAGSLFAHYTTLLNAAGYEVAKSWPYAYDYFDNGVSIPDVARRLYRDMADSADIFGDPRRTDVAGGYFHWLNEPVAASPRPSLTITRLWRAVYDQSRDLQIAFPAALGAKRKDFVQWARTSGAKELGIDESFIPPDWNTSGSKAAE